MPQFDFLKLFSVGRDADACFGIHFPGVHCNCITVDFPTSKIHKHTSSIYLPRADMPVINSWHWLLGLLLRSKVGSSSPDGTYRSWTSLYTWLTKTIKFSSNGNWIWLIRSLLAALCFNMCHLGNLNMYTTVTTASAAEVKIRWQWSLIFNELNAFRTEHHITVESNPKRCCCVIPFHCGYRKTQSQRVVSTSQWSVPFWNRTEAAAVAHFSSTNHNDGFGTVLSVGGNWHLNNWTSGWKCFLLIPTNRTIQQRSATTDW